MRLAGPIRSWLLDLERWGLLRLAQGRWQRMQARHIATGERGELEAVFFLRRRGYQMVERRWRTPELRGDLDLIAWDQGTLCMVEVKARTARDFAPAASAVDSGKVRMLRKMAKAYRATLPRARRESIVIRFDIVSVYLLGETVECEVAQNAFPLEEDRPEFFLAGTIPGRYGV